MTNKKFAPYAPVVLRFALVAVYTWFGVSQITHPTMWTGLVPSWASALSGMDARAIVHANGYFEVLMAALLAFGIYVPYVAGFLFLHLLVITIHLGVGPVGVRDFGLSFATLALALFGGDHLCLTQKKDVAQ